jgi:hypothetical protein
VKMSPDLKGERLKGLVKGLVKKRECAIGLLLVYFSFTCLLPSLSWLGFLVRL